MILIARLFCAIALHIVGIQNAGLCAASDALDVVRTVETQVHTDYRFSTDDTQLLDEIQRGCFDYLWQETSESSGLVKDRRLANVCSVAGVGFQLSSLPIGVERGWITPQQGRDRALGILRTLAGRDDNRKFGVFLHYVDLETGGVLPDNQSEQASTVDHALFLAGALTAGEYFGAEIAKLVHNIVEATNWRAFAEPENGLISFGWRPERSDLSGPGNFEKFKWQYASDEELLLYFLAAGAPRAEFAGEPRDYYRLERVVKKHEEMAPFVASWNGAMFTYFFAHCWIDYRRFEADEPSRFGVERPRVDWFENSRRATLTHRQRCLESSNQFATLGEGCWGLAPCMGKDREGKDAYLVQSLRPNIADDDQLEGGTVAPYAAGSAIMFTPAESLAALRSLRQLKDRDGKSLAWRGPEEGGYGFADSVNVDQQFASEDQVAIDVGPLLLAIENVRTGLIWRLFMQHSVAQASVERLQLTPIVQ